MQVQQNWGSYCLKYPGKNLSKIKTRIDTKNGNGEKVLEIVL